MVIQFKMATKQQELDSMLRQQQINQLSSEQQQGRDQVISKSQFRKPIKNAFSDDELESDSDLQYQNEQTTGTPFPPKPPAAKTVLQQVQEGMKWDKNEQVEVDILARLEGQGMKDKKIRELASKYKTLNIAYEKQKTQRKNLQNQLNNILKTNDDLNKSTVQKRQKKSLQKTTAAQCSNCKQNQKKIMQFRLTNQNLKSELNKAHRVLTRELGEDFSIDQALSEDNGWKGRQQKIEKLKGRVKQLEQKLNNNGINVSHMSGFTQISSATRTNNQGFSSTRTSALMAQNKKKQFDNLKIQVDALKSENEILQGKVKSLVSRKVILENEMKQLKSDFEKKRQLLIEKSDNDDKFIELLKNENEKLKKDERVVTKVIYKDDGTEAAQLRKELEQLRRKLKVAQSAKTIPPAQTQPPKQNQQALSKKPPKDINSLPSKDVNSVPPNPARVLSAEKKKRMEEQYLRSNKYLSKMTAEDQEQLYKNWKNARNT